MGGLVGKMEKMPLGVLNLEMGVGVQSTFRSECIPSRSLGLRRGEMCLSERGNLR